MDTKKRILKIMELSDSVSGPQLTEALGISRQALNKHLKVLIESGLVYKTGVTRGARYRKGPGRRPSMTAIHKIYPLTGLKEDEVFRQMRTALNLSGRVSSNTYGLLEYAFTEMLNNAIDHSYSDDCRTRIFLGKYDAEFTIRDYGIGLFESIKTNFNLKNEGEAVGELLKGRSTTMAEKHSGEGIFFTSRIADYIRFKSHTATIAMTGGGQDVILTKNKFIQGTEVVFRLSRQSNRDLDKIFRQYAPEEFDYKFEKTKITVKLFEEDYLSRSSAKRLLHGLDKFKEIVLDFSRVNSIGQGFADEVFRVFKKTHPAITVAAENTAEPVAIMIRHVVDNKI